MRGTGAVTIDGATVYAYFAADCGAYRLRLSADDYDRLDLFPGKPAWVGIPGREPARALLTAAVPDPPFVWVEAEVSAMSMVWAR